MGASAKERVGDKHHGLGRLRHGAGHNAGKNGGTGQAAAHVLRVLVQRHDVDYPLGDLVNSHLTKHYLALKVFGIHFNIHIHIHSSISRGILQSQFDTVSTNLWT